MGFMSNMSVRIVEDGVVHHFCGEYSFLSNFYPCRVVLNGLTYQSSEAAYQAQKTNDRETQELFTQYTPAKAKQQGRLIVLKDNWERMKMLIMESILIAKFQDSVLAEMLKQTFPKVLIEGNDWGDTYWGVCNGEGQNHLGVLLMRVRDML